MREPLTDAELTELVRDLRFEPGSQAPQRTLRAADALEQLRRERDEALDAARQLRAMMQRAVMFAGAVGCDEEANDDAAEIVCDGAKLSADTAWLAAPEPQEPPKGRNK